MYCTHCLPTKSEGYRGERSQANYRLVFETTTPLLRNNRFPILFAKLNKKMSVNN
jgi:hypothetical protein